MLFFMYQIAALQLVRLGCKIVFGFKAQGRGQGGEEGRDEGGGWSLNRRNAAGNVRDHYAVVFTRQDLSRPLSPRSPHKKEKQHQQSPPRIGTVRICRHTICGTILILSCVRATFDFRCGLHGRFFRCLIDTLNNGRLTKKRPLCSSDQ